MSINLTIFWLPYLDHLKWCSTRGYNLIYSSHDNDDENYDFTTHNFFQSNVFLNRTIVLNENDATEIWFKEYLFKGNIKQHCGRIKWCLRCKYHGIMFEDKIEIQWMETEETKKYVVTKKVSLLAFWEAAGKGVSRGNERHFCWNSVVVDTKGHAEKGLSGIKHFYRARPFCLPGRGEKRQLIGNARNGMYFTYICNSILSILLTEFKFLRILLVNSACHGNALWHTPMSV